jgi:hypothetical protein
MLLGPTCSIYIRKVKNVYLPSEYQILRMFDIRLHLLKYDQTKNEKKITFFTIYSQNEDTC